MWAFFPTTSTLISGQRAFLWNLHSTRFFGRRSNIPLRFAMFFSIHFTSLGPLCSISIAAYPRVYWDTNQVYEQQAFLFRCARIVSSQIFFFTVLKNIFGCVSSNIFIGLHNDFIYAAVYISKYTLNKPIISVDFNVFYHLC